MPKYSYRVDVLRKGAKLTELKCAAPFTVAANNDAEICMTLSGDFKPNPLVDYYTDTLEPHIVIDGVDYPIGRYVVGTVGEKHSSGHDVDTIEAYDYALILQQTKIENAVSFAAGTRYTDIVEEQLIACGIISTIITPSELTLPIQHCDWEIGTSYLKIINDLLAEINYDAIWFDTTGAAHAEPYAAPSIENVTQTYTSGEMSIIEPDCTSEVDAYDVPNVFVATVSNPEQEAWRKTAVNDSPASLLSTLHRGRRIMAPLIKLDSVASETALQQYVDNEVIKSMLAHETATFSTAINPTHGVGDIIALAHEKLSGVYEEVEWSITPGEHMTHKVRRVTYL